jgi:hypothetical protein
MIICLIVFYLLIACLIAGLCCAFRKQVSIKLTDIEFAVIVPIVSAGWPIVLTVIWLENQRLND